MMSFREKYLKYKSRTGKKNSPVSKRMLQTLIDNVDFETLLLRLGIEAQVCDAGKGEYCGYCPDHALFKGAPPSHPKWYINSKTGLSYCQTESRGSNIIEIAKNLMSLETNEQAFEKLLDGKPIEIRFKPRIVEQEEKVEEVTESEKLKEALEMVSPMFDEGRLSEECIAFFERDGITLDTLLKFGVISCNYGRYKDRALIPFLNKELELIGFIAVDLLGKEKWVETHIKYHLGIDSSKTYEELYPLFLKKYKKTLYCPGFKSRNHLYGFYEFLKFKELVNELKFIVLVEGERDALKLLQEGIPCISVHGTHIKDNQRLLLKTSGIVASLDELFLGFDMDDPGNVATEKAYEIFSKEVDSDKIYVLNFPEGKDPKKFNGQEILSFIEYSRKNKIHSRG